MICVQNLFLYTSKTTNKHSTRGFSSIQKSFRSMQILLCSLLCPVTVWGIHTFFFFYSPASLYCLKMNCICCVSAHAPPPCQSQSESYHLPILFWHSPGFVLSGNFITLLLVLSSRVLICCINSTKLVQIMILKAFHYSHLSSITCSNSQDSYVSRPKLVFLFFSNQSISPYAILIHLTD